MRRLLIKTNLGPALVAIGLLVGLVFGLDFPFWLALVLAGIAFGGMLFLKPKAVDEAEIARARQAEAARVLASGAQVVRQIRKTSRYLRAPEAKARVEAIGDRADQILLAMGEDRRDPRLARAFVDRYLTPSATLLARYERLAGRRVAAAEPALEKIEREDLPLIERKFDELYDQLHRGDLIDLEVASEMLEFNLDGIDAPSPRSVER